MLSEQWRKSSRSGSESNCVEVRCVAKTIEVRNSNWPEAGSVLFTPAEWTAFLAGAADGEFSID